MTIDRLLNPASVAIIGASDNPNKIGGRPIRFMRMFGFQGEIYPINPARTEVQGLRAYKSVSDLPKTPDAAIIAVAGAAVKEAVAACAERGVGAAVIMASGFGETGESGKAIEQDMRAIARKAGMRLIGPNSLGIANFGNGAVLSFATMFLEAPPADGPVACISQSGAMSVVPYGLLRERGIGVRHVHSTGNDVDVTVSELAISVVQDPDIRLVLLYLESLADPENLAEAARIAHARGVRMIAVKSGRSDDGRRAAASHTGAIATSDRLVDTFFEKVGIWRATGTADLVDSAELYLKAAPPHGRNLAVVSNSGATCVLSADAAEREGFQLARLSDETVADLRGILPEFAATVNPIDITAALLSNSGLFSQVLPALGADPSVEALLVGIPVSGEGYDYPRFAQDARDFVDRFEIPLVAAIPQPKVRAAFADLGIPCFPTDEQAVTALGRFVRHHEQIAATQAREPFVPKALPDRASRILDESRSLAILEEYGIACVRRQLCSSPEEALAFFRGVGGAVVLKACSAEIPHKSDHGLVRVNLVTEEDVARAYDDIAARVKAGGWEVSGILIGEMVRGEREIVIGGHIDPHFGPVVMVGDGGELVEAMPDNILLLPPFTREEVERQLGKLRLAPMFEEVRGRIRIDRESVVDAVMAAGALMQTNRFRSLDMNPLIADASGLVAVDALVEEFEEGGASD